MRTEIKAQIFHQLLVNNFNCWRVTVYIYLTNGHTLKFGIIAIMRAMAPQSENLHISTIFGPFLYLQFSYLAKYNLGALLMLNNN